jgi:hypothetical protein
LRLLPTLLVSGLIVATAAAFAVTEGLKLQHSPITNTHVAKVFSPLCKCSTAAASIAFRLRSADRVTVAIERGGKVVQTLVRAHAARRGWFRVRWLGRDSAGRPFPDGSYMPRVHLRRAHRTIVLPNPIVLDTAPPRLSVGHFFPALLTPDHNRIHERFEVRYHVNEPAHVSLYVDGKARFFSRFTNLDDKARWFGKVGGRGVPAGAYAITLEARDLAGNLSKAARVTTLQVRYVRLRRNVIRSRAGALFSARVLTDAPRVLWRLGARHGAGPPNLVLRAPSRKGSYRLAIRVGDHSASGLLIVRPRG